MLQIADFLWARRVDADENGKFTRTMYTSNYSAPELAINPQCLSSSIDVYSAGLILVEILTLVSPLLQPSILSQLFPVNKFVS